jgi:hypothetical protein
MEFEGKSRGQRTALRHDGKREETASNEFAIEENFVAQGRHSYILPEALTLTVRGRRMNEKDIHRPGQNVMPLTRSDVES